MKVEKSTVTKLIITDAPRLDPIAVYVEDIGPHQGKVTIECYSKSWSAYWGGCGNKGVAAFFRSCNADYLANCLDRGIDGSIVDSESIRDGALRQIIALRRGHMVKSFREPSQLVRYGRADITATEARELWEEVDSAEFGDDGWREPELLQRLFGDEWWYRLPTKPNPKYVYLCRIVSAVQDGLEMSAQQTETVAA